jgi:hypothetical protein
MTKSLIIMTNQWLRVTWSDRVPGHSEKTLRSCMCLTVRLTPTTRTMMELEFLAECRRWLLTPPLLWQTLSAHVRCHRLMQPILGMKGHLLPFTRLMELLSTTSDCTFMTQGSSKRFILTSRPSLREGEGWRHKTWFSTSHALAMLKFTILISQRMELQRLG